MQRRFLGRQQQDHEGAPRATSPDGQGLHQDLLALLNELRARRRAVEQLMDGTESDTDDQWDGGRT